MDDSPYRPPQARLDKEPKPVDFGNTTLTPNKLRFAGWMCFVYLLLYTAQIGYSFLGNRTGFAALDNETGQWSDSYVLDSLVLVIEIFLLWRLKQLLNSRFQLYKTDKYIIALIIMSVLFTATNFPMDDDNNPFSPLMLILYALLVPYGIAMVLLGRNMLGYKEYCKYYRPYTYLTITTGIMSATIILMLLAIPFFLIIIVLQGLLFLGAAKELGEFNQTQKTQGYASA